MQDGGGRGRQQQLVGLADGISCAASSLLAKCLVGGAGKRPATQPLVVEVLFLFLLLLVCSGAAGR